MTRSLLITPRGASELRNELADLWKNKRPDIVKALSEAAAEGDRSENAEYIYRKKQLREVDRRVRYLQKRIQEMKVIEHFPSDQSTIFFGATVELEYEDGSQHQYTLVGSDEFNLQENKISIDSPLARALVKKQLHDIVEIHTPNGKKTATVIQISYTR